MSADARGDRELAALRRRIRRHWDELADSFDDEPDHGLADPVVRDAWRTRLRSYLPPPPGVVVDVACGTGTLAVLLAEDGFRVVGVELSDRMLARAAAKAQATGVAARFVCADAAAPALRGCVADAVLVRHLAWTLPDPDAAVESWLRLLRPGGRLVLVEGRWATADRSEGGDASRRLLPWHGGVTATQLRAAVAPHVERLRVDDLAGSPQLWGRPVTDERYALIATVGGRG